MKTSGIIKFFIINLFFLSIALSCSAGITKLTKDETSSLKPSGEITNGIRLIKVQAKQYQYLPDPIVVVQGEQVQIDLTTLDVTHGFSIPELKIDQAVSPGKTESVIFKADKEGKYNIHCSVFCGLGHFVMGGTLDVLPAETTN